jgi:hypothetical protein
LKKLLGLALSCAVLIGLGVPAAAISEVPTTGSFSNSAAFKSASTVCYNFDLAKELGPGYQGKKWSKSGSRVRTIEWSMTSLFLDSTTVSRLPSELEKAQIRSAVIKIDSVLDTVDFLEVSGSYAQIRIGWVDLRRAGVPPIDPREATSTRSSYGKSIYKAVIRLNSLKEYVFIERAVAQMLLFVLGFDNLPNDPFSSPNSSLLLRAIYGESTCRSPVGGVGEIALEGHEWVGLVPNEYRNFRFGYSGTAQPQAVSITPEVCSIYQRPYKVKGRLNLWALSLRSSSTGICSFLVSAREPSSPQYSSVGIFEVKVDQFLTKSNLPKTLKIGKSHALSFASISGNRIEMNADWKYCERRGARTIVGVKPGKCVVTVSLHGDDFYANRQIQLRVSIVK